MRNLSQNGSVAAAAPAASWVARLAWALVACVYGWLVTTGAVGINFGSHWDEWYHRHGLMTCVNTLTLMPGTYSYNGLYFDLGMLLVLPEIARASPTIAREVATKPSRPLDMKLYPAVVALQARLSKQLQSARYLLQARFVFLALSALVVLWVFLLARATTKSALSAAAAAALVGLSFEVGYHARFIAVDALMMQAGALCFWQLHRLVRAPDDETARSAATWAGVAGGLALGCKLPGVFFYVPVAVAALLAPGAARVGRALWRRRLVLLLRATAFFALAFVATTPGVVLDPLRYYGAVAFESTNYRSHYVPPYFVSGPVEHLTLLLRWLLIAVPSSTPALSVPLALVSLLGAWHLWRAERRLVVVLGSYVLVAAGFLVTNQQLIVRNDLVFVPLLALCFGWGCRGLSDVVEQPLLRGLLIAGAVGIFAGNAAHLASAARSIQVTTAASILDEAAAYVRGHAPKSSGGDPLLVSPALHAALGAGLGDDVRCAPLAPGEDPPALGSVVAFAKETSKDAWKANRADTVERVLSSHEVNYDYYPSWRARHYRARVDVFTARAAVRSGFPTSTYWRCARVEAGPATFDR